jgi:hypothetical protein
MFYADRRRAYMKPPALHPHQLHLLSFLSKRSLGFLLLPTHVRHDCGRGHREDEIDQVSMVDIG